MSVKITMDDIRACSGCAWGVRKFFRRYGLDMQAFIERGWIDSDEFIKTGDELALQIVRYVQARGQ